LGTEFLVHHRKASMVKWVQFVSDRLSHIILRGCWCNVLNAHVPSEEKNEVSKDILYKEFFFIFFLSKIWKFCLEILKQNLPVFVLFPSMDSIKWTILILSEIWNNLKVSNPNQTIKCTN
jgi:hypothetical protein